AAAPVRDSRGAIVVSAALRVVRRPHRRIGRDVNLLTLRHQGKPGERVRVLTADQDTDATQPCLGHPKPSAVAVGPRELLPERRHELAVVIEHAAIVADEHVGVPQAPYALLGPLVEPEGDEDAGAARGRRDAVRGSAWRWPPDGETTRGCGWARPAPTTPETRECTSPGRR